MGRERQEIIATLPVAEVTLLEDRAHVVRQGKVEVAAGATRVVVEAVAPVLVDKTLVAVVVGDSAARVVDARVRRRVVIRVDGEEATSARDSAAARLEAELEELRRDLTGKRDRLTGLARYRKGLEGVATQTLADLTSDVAWGQAPGAAWATKLDELRDSERKVGAELFELSREISACADEEARLQIRIAAFDSPTESEAARIEVELAASAAATVELRLDYVVPGACWRPYHVAQLNEQGDDSTVEFATDACVWQNSGEDWSHVDLILSTERASLGTEPPELESDELSCRRKSDAIVVEARDQEIETTGLGAATSTAVELPGIDDGGEVLNLRAPGPADVPSDGKPYRVRLAAFTAPATVELVAFPELSSCVLGKSIQVNAGPGPILAGPVDLIRDSGRVGRTSVLYIAAGERFELGWGPDAELRLKRHDEVTREKSRRLSSWVKRKHQIEVRLSNLGASACVVAVTERVPVSEIDKVKIELDSKATTGGVEPDANGFVHWTVKLAPFGHDKVELGYVLRKHEDVVGI